MQKYTPQQLLLLTPTVLFVVWTGSLIFFGGACSLPSLVLWKEVRNAVYLYFIHLLLFIGIGRIFKKDFAPGLVRPAVLSFTAVTFSYVVFLFLYNLSRFRLGCN